MESEKKYVDHGATYTGNGPALSQSTWNNKSLKKGSKSINTMRLFGLPYQFIETVDPRLTEINSAIGHMYLKNITTNAPIAYIIPGKPTFLPNKNGSKKSSTAKTLLSAADKQNFSEFKSVLSSKSTEKLRYYDFQEDYPLYMKYVNAMCRTVAGFLDLDQKMNSNKKAKTFERYDWKNYRFDMDYWKAGVTAGTAKLMQTATSKIEDKIIRVKNKIKKGENKSVKLNTKGKENNTASSFRTNNFVAFYIDPTSSISEDLGNTTTQSQIKQMLDSASSTMKEVQFLTNSAGVDTEGLETFTDSAFGALDTMMNNFGALGNVISRIATAGSAVIKGENISIPDIYDRSSASRSYTLDVHLKAPYGNKFAVYMDVIVPMLHLLALVLPRQSTANTYGSPFLVKIFYPGVYNCNLGIVTSISINKAVSPESWTTDGLPNEIDVSLQIQDLYSDITMSPSSDPTLFVNNGSLIDYLATVSGLDLIEPQISRKIKMFMTAYKNAFTEIGSNAMAGVTSALDRKLQSFMSLS